MSEAVKKSDRTREALVDGALKLFRRRGFDGTTMRDIAAVANMSLGAAYYYFRSKEEIVHAYYERVQERHEAAVPTRFADDESLAERVRSILQAKVAIVEKDRRFLGALFRFVAEPNHPLGIFAERTRDIRERSVELFARALEGIGPPDVEPELARRLAEALWLAHLGILLFLLSDESPRLRRTYALANIVADTSQKLLLLLSLPMARAMMLEFSRSLAKAINQED